MQLFSGNPSTTYREFLAQIETLKQQAATRPAARPGAAGAGEGRVPDRGVTRSGCFPGLVRDAQGRRYNIEMQVRRYSLERCAGTGVQA